MTHGGLSSVQCLSVINQERDKTMIEFKVGDIVIFNPDFYECDVKGTITEETTDWGSNKIQWDDGTTGDIHLESASAFLLHAN